VVFVDGCCPSHSRAARVLLLLLFLTINHYRPPASSLPSPSYHPQPFPAHSMRSKFKDEHPFGESLSPVAVLPPLTIHLVQRSARQRQSVSGRNTRIESLLVVLLRASYPCSPFISASIGDLRESRSHRHSDDRQEEVSCALCAYAPPIMADCLAWCLIFGRYLGSDCGAVRLCYPETNQAGS
jgi:hypothetical protein